MRVMRVVCQKKRSPLGMEGVEHGRLSDPDASLRPTMFVSSAVCPDAGMLALLQHDPNRPKDVLKVGAG